MCLPCGSSVSLTNAASKHSVLRPRPCGSLLKGERRGGWAPGLCAPGGTSLLPSPGGREVTLPSVLCMLGWRGGSYKGRLEMFSLLSFFLSFSKIRFSPTHSWKTTIPPAVSKSFSFGKRTFSLLLLASVDLFQAAITFSGMEYGAEAFINGRGRQAPVV